MQLDATSQAWPSMGKRSIDVDLDVDLRVLWSLGLTPSGESECNHVKAIGICSL